LDKKGRLDIVRKAPMMMVVAAQHQNLLPLMSDRYRWPIVIIIELMRAGAGCPLRASDLIEAGVRSYGLKAIGAPYFRDLVSALREGGAPIKSERYRGYWWDG